MPEGHSIHRAARDQQKLVGAVVRASSPQGRFADGAARIDRARVEAIEAFGKHLFYRFRKARRVEIVHVHLGLAGKFRWRASPPPAPRGAVRLRLVAPERTLDLSGSRVCELIDEGQYEAILARLGPDPLSPRARPAKLAARLAKTKVPIGAMLLDQSAIAGLGNIYRAEVLYLARIDPRRASSACSTDDVQAIWKLSRALLRSGVAKAGQIVTLDARLPGAPAIELGPEPGRRRNWVYKQSLCHHCGTPIEHARLAGRPCYYCPRCQH